jgi:hypothetical protein
VLISHRPIKQTIPARPTGLVSPVPFLPVFTKVTHLRLPISSGVSPAAQAACRYLRSPAVPREFNILALVKGKERYVFVYDDASRHALLDVFRDQAADPRLSFNWFDAAVLTEKARSQEQAPPAVEQPPRSRIPE